MSATPYVPFYTSDFLAGTSGMTSSTKGVYITLLCLMYETEGPLTQKWDTLARRCGSTLPAFKRAVSDLLDDGKLDDMGDTLWSSKCEKHITQRRERSDSAKSAAKKRWEKTEQKQRGGNADALTAHCQPEPEPEPYKEDTNVSSVRFVFPKQDFQDFWDAYPHRSGKKNRAGAEKSFGRAIKGGVTVQQIADGVSNMMKDPNVQRGYARDPTTWLNQKGWTDEFSEQTPQFKAISGGRYEQPASKSEKRTHAFISGATGAP